MEYSIVYAKRRTLSLCIKNGALVVRAPYGTSKERIEVVITKHSKWIKNALDRQKARNEALLSLTEDDIRLLKEKARIVLGEKAAKFAEMMELEYNRISITNAKTRFGSCSSKGNISFSYRLMLYPEAAIDYVVVHELSHLVEMNHSPRFWSVVEKYMPDYKERKKLLKPKM